MLSVDPRTGRVMRDSQTEFATEIFGIRSSGTVWGRDDLTSRAMEDYLQVGDYLQIGGLGKKKKGFGAKLKKMTKGVVKVYKKVNPLFIAKRMVLDPLLKMVKGGGKKKGGGEEEYEEGAELQPSMPIEDRQGEETPPISEESAPSSSIEDRPGASEPPVEDRRGASEPPVEDRGGAESEPVQENEQVPEDTGESVEGCGGYMITGPVPMDVYDIEHKKTRVAQLSPSRRRTKKWEGGRLTYGAKVPAGRTLNRALTPSRKRTRGWERGPMSSSGSTWESMLSGNWDDGLCLSVEGLGENETLQSAAEKLNTTMWSATMAIQKTLGKSSSDNEISAARFLGYTTINMAQQKWFGAGFNALLEKENPKAAKDVSDSFDALSTWSRKAADEEIRRRGKLSAILWGTVKSFFGGVSDGIERMGQILDDLMKALGAAAAAAKGFPGWIWWAGAAAVLFTFGPDLLRMFRR